jgi:hypothetical protein
MYSDLFALFVAVLHWFACLPRPIFDKLLRYREVHWFCRKLLGHIYNSIPLCRLASCRKHLPENVAIPIDGNSVQLLSLLNR